MYKHTNMYTWAGVQGSTLPPHPHAYNPTPSGVGGWVGGCPPPLWDPVGGGGCWVGARGIHRRRSKKSMHACTHVRMYVCMHAC